MFFRAGKMTSVREVQRAVPGVHLQISRVCSAGYQARRNWYLDQQMTLVYYPSCETIYTAAGVKQARDGIPAAGRVPMGDASFELVKARKQSPRQLRSWGCRLMGRQTDARSLYTALPVLLCGVLCAAMCSALIKTSLSIKQQRMVGWRPQ